MSYRRKYAIFGVALGLIYVAADLLLEWRGPLYGPWIGLGIVTNIVQIITSVVLFTGIAWLIGWGVDRFATRSDPQRRR
jgi:hypothetical protein